MATSTPLPRTLDGWLKKLDAVRLPVLASQHEKLRLALGNSRYSLRELTDLMQDSPAVALSLMREANRNVSGLVEPAQSLEVALARVGIKGAEQLLNRLPAVEPEAMAPALQQLLLISQHASQQARGLFGGRLARLWQEVHWGSLLFLAPLWPLVATQPALFTAWEQRVLVGGEPAARVERELLGVPVLALCLALAEHWQLPPWITQGYRLLIDDRRRLVRALQIARNTQHPLEQQQQLDADLPLRHWLTQPGNTLLLANGLALSAHHCWECPHSLRWQQLTGLYLQAPLDEVQQLVHQQAAHSAQLQAELGASVGLWHPAEALLWPWDARHLTSAIPAPKLEANLWRNHCTTLLSEPSAFTTALQLTLCVREALQACGFSRILLLLADRTHSELHSQQSVGLPAEAARLKLDPSHSQVLRHLLKQPGQLRVTPANAAQFSASLPGALKTLFSSDHLLMRSLASNERVVMVLVLDQGGGPLSEISLNALAKTVTCIERGLASFAKRGR